MEGACLLKRVGEGLRALAGAVGEDGVHLPEEPGARGQPREGTGGDAVFRDHLPLGRVDHVQVLRADPHVVRGGTRHRGPAEHGTLARQGGPIWGVDFLADPKKFSAEVAEEILASYDALEVDYAVDVWSRAY